MPLSIITAVAQNGIIGKNNQLPWHLPADMKYFKKKTTCHSVIMGRKSYESIMEFFGKPLNNRINIVVTRQQKYQAPGCKVAGSLSEALTISRNDPEPFIIGGAEVYKDAIKLADRLYLTRIHQNFDGDSFFPDIDHTIWNEISKDFHKKDEKNKYDYTFYIYERI